MDRSADGSQRPDVVIGGGASLLPEESEAYLKGNGYGIFKNDIDGMRNYKGNNMWALFGDREMAYDIDRDRANSHPWKR